MSPHYKSLNSRDSQDKLEMKTVIRKLVSLPVTFRGFQTFSLSQAGLSYLEVRGWEPCHHTMEQDSKKK